MRRVWSLAAIMCIHLAAAPVVQAAEHGEAGKPSLFAGDLGNAIWTLVIFFVLLVVLRKFAWKPLLKALQDREKYIHESLASAKRDRESAEARLKEYEQRLAQARTEAGAVIDEARRDAENVKRKLEDDARKSAEGIAERAKREINLARDTALKELYEQSARLAMNMASQVLQRQLTPEDHQRLVRDALSKLPGGSEN
jgi:F-type H+-transporting ATPase subunit b